jgi:hypothetical protein
MVKFRNEATRSLNKSTGKDILMNARTLIEKIEALPDERKAEVERYVDLIRDQEELRRRNWQVTVEVMEAARRGEVATVDGVGGLMAYLHADGDEDA